MLLTIEYQHSENATAWYIKSDSSFKFDDAEYFYFRMFLFLFTKLRICIDKKKKMGEQNHRQSFRA